MIKYKTRIIISAKIIRIKIPATAFVLNLNRLKKLFPKPPVWVAVSVFAMSSMEEELDSKA